MSKRFFAYLIIAAGFIFMLSVSWLKWGNILIDTYRDPYVAGKILNGAVLYKDIGYEMGPLTPYLLAFIAKIFGIGIYTFVGCGIVLTILMVVLIYRISRLFLSRLACVEIILIFLMLFAIREHSHGDMCNSIIPYSFAMAIYVFFNAAALYCLLKFILTDKRLYIKMWVVFIIFSFLARPVMSLPTWLGFSLVLSIFGWRHSWHRCGNFFVVAIIPFGISVIVYFIYFFNTGTFSFFRETVFGMAKLSYIYKNEMCIYNLPDSLKKILFSFIWEVGAAFFIACFSVCFAYRSRLKKRVAAFFIPLSACIVFCSFMFYKNNDHGYYLYASLPLVVAAGVPIYFFRMLHRRQWKNDFALFAIFIFSLFVSNRIMLHTYFTSASSGLLFSSLVCYFIFLLKTSRIIFSPLLSNKSSLFFYRIIMMSFLICMPIVPIRRSLENFADKTKLIINKTTGNKIFLYPSRDTDVLIQLFNYIAAHTIRKDTLTVVPEGIGIYYFLHRDSPVKYYHVNPGFLENIGEGKIINEFSKNRPDFIAIVEQDARGYGKSFFGKDYGVGLDKWIKKNYTLEKVFGIYPYNTKEFGAALYRKNQTFGKELK